MENEFAVTSQGDQVTRVRLKHPNGFLVDVVNYGATIIHVGPEGENLTYCHTDMKLMEDRKLNPYFGATCGRVANISSSVMTVDGKEFKVAPNFGTSGVHHLHGGIVGFDQRIWSIANTTQSEGEASVELHLTSPDGEEGYPGTLHVACIISLSKHLVLGIQYKATVEGAATPLNLANHCYWSLDAGRAPSGDALDHCLKLYASTFVNSHRGTQCPPPGSTALTGVRDVRMAAPEGVYPCDFRETRRLGDLVQYATAPEEAEQVGWNFSFVVDGYGKEAGEEDTALVPAEHVAKVHGQDAISRLRAGAVLSDPEHTGRAMGVSTTQPCVHLYTSNYWDGSTGVDGRVMKRWGAVCLETQFPPDSANRGYGNIPACVLKPGQEYNHLTAHQFHL